MWLWPFTSDVEAMECAVLWEDGPSLERFKHLCLIAKVDVVPKPDGSDADTITVQGTPRRMARFRSTYTLLRHQGRI